ncbi:PD-(D/E)XK nuclease family protein [Ornithinimicrobium sp. F0845]|uniref:ATP-dependent DNA helicase n=1 Tax=Ornithinimicrobium sp. F0845 TaxID=2926412 RepID=UPI001FF6E489|nr:ATP-dependent DNA helicase [Ornithinimicrobium sp. F0845]MCK0111097.1 PD-(D/E)XK nuclease family protein [Ornithinimicrobium sp. F0845]
MTSPDDLLDDSQRAAVRERAPVLQVVGAPGTGKTRVAVATVVDRVARDGIPADAALVLAPTRVAAGALRDTITAAVGGTTTQPLARTPSAFAFSLLVDAAASDDEPAPRLLSGAEQDVVLGDLLAGHRESGGGPRWPGGLREALPTRGFRDQLRDLLMRTVEHGLGPEELTDLAGRHDRPEWAAAAQVLREYDEVTALQRPSAYDPAWICTAAADRLAGDPELLRIVRRRIRLVVVDDAQELTASAARLIEQLYAPGMSVVLIGDGDVTGQGFRGADPARFSRLAERLAARSGATPGRAVLRTSHRRGERLLIATGRVVDRIGATTGVEHRRPQPPATTGVEPQLVTSDAPQPSATSDAPQPAATSDAPQPSATSDPPQPSAAGDSEPPVRVLTVRTAAQESALVAGWFREAHLGDRRVPWSRMAVLARSRSRLEQVRRTLVSAGVPVQERAGTGPLHEHPVVRALLLALEVSLRPEGQGCTAAEAVDLVTSSVGGADPVALMRLRRVLAASEREAGGARPSEEVLAALLDQPGALRLMGFDAAPAAHLAEVLSAGRAAATRGEAGGWAPGVTAETVLWAIWSTAGVADDWRSAALAGGAAGARADRDLDAVMTLFGAAEAYVERLPGRGPDGFLTHVRSQEVSPDSLVARARSAEAVEVLTPQAAAGREWDLVAVIGVQEGVWPDLRLRDSLLGAEALVSVLRGRPVEGTAGLRAAQAQVRADEVRQFYAALTRARESLLVTAVASTDEQPSSFLGLVDPVEGERVPVDVSPPLTLRSLVARLRADLVRAHRDGDHAGRDRAATHLITLDDAGVPGADPAGWWAARALSDERGLQQEGPVPVSPSRVQLFSECRLRWLLGSRGGEAGGLSAAAVGTLVHDVIAVTPEAPFEQLSESLRSRWHELALGEGWVQSREWTRAQRMLERYVAYVAEAAGQGRELVGVELELTAAHERARITGRVDRLERTADGDLFVVDLKTGKSRPSKKDIEHHPQLGVYQVGIVEGGGPGLLAQSSQSSPSSQSSQPSGEDVSGPAGPAYSPGPELPGTGGAALVQLGAPGGSPQAGHRVDRQAPLGDDPEPRWAHDLVAQTAEGMAGDQFPASPGDWCRVCPVRFSCPIQQEGRMLA